MATQNRSLQRAVRYALLAGAAGAAATALPTQAADQTIQEVVVTGSRIAQPNLETTSPVTQMTADDIAVTGKPSSSECVMSIAPIRRVELPQLVVQACCCSPFWSRNLMSL